jgi:opacity protein-like surface antigen
MRYPISVVAASGLFLVIVSGEARAQEQRFNFSLGGGWTAPSGEVGDRFGDGYNFNIGFQVNVTPVIAIEGLYSYNGLGEKSVTIPVYPDQGLPPVPTDFFANTNIQYGTVSLIAQKPEGPVRPYGLVGMGVYYRPVQVTTPGVGFVPGYCDPWWYVCYPGGFVPVDNIIGERSSTDFGMVFGGGVNFGKIYTELRYHYVWGPTIQNPLDGSEIKADGKFLALTFGVRF